GRREVVHNPSVIDQAAKLASLLCQFNGLIHCSLVRDVTDNGRGGSTCVLNECGGLVRPGFRKVLHNHVCAMLCCELGGRASYSRTRSGDDYHAIIECQGHVFSSICPCTVVEHLAQAYGSQTVQTIRGKCCDSLVLLLPVDTADSAE